MRACLVHYKMLYNIQILLKGGILEREKDKKKTNLRDCELCDWVPSRWGQHRSLLRLLTESASWVTLETVVGDPNPARDGGNGCMSSSYMLTSIWGTEET